MAWWSLADMAGWSLAGSELDGGGVVRLHLTHAGPSSAALVGTHQVCKNTRIVFAYNPFLVLNSRFSKLRVFRVFTRGQKNSFFYLIKKNIFPEGITERRNLFTILEFSI